MNMVKADVYSIKGTKKESIKLPEIFNQKINRQLLAQAIRVYMDRRHYGLSKTKTRGEVKISTRKIYRQKGTGYARHGAKSAPIFVGGGIAHGPKGLKRKLTLPKKMKQKALQSALSLKAKKGNVVVIDGLNLVKKTKDASVLFNKLFGIYPTGKVKKATLVLSSDNNSSSMFFRNLADCNIAYYKTLNAYKVFYGGLLVLDKDIIVKKVKAKSEKAERTVKSDKNNLTKKESKKSLSTKRSKIKDK